MHRTKVFLLGIAGLIQSLMLSVLPVLSGQQQQFGSSQPFGGKGLGLNRHKLVILVALCLLVFFSFSRSD